jgi:putative aldouronate transport system permease protein
MAPAILFILLFHYQPMYGVQIAFKDFRTSLGIWASPWIGFRHFVRFFNLPSFWRILGNTLGLSAYQLIVGFPVPVFLALMINEVRHQRFKRAWQMITYAPHFISTVVMAGLIILFLDPETGIVNHALEALGSSRIDFMARPEWFKTVFVVSGVWQNAGWGTIIYLAALSTVDPQLIDSARIDGASRLQKIRYIDFPSIAPTVTILLILQIGQLMTVGFEKVLLLQNPLNMASSDVIQTFVYRVGLIGAEFSFSSAVGLFNSVVNVMLLVTANSLSRRIAQSSLW